MRHLTKLLSLFSVGVLAGTLATSAFGSEGKIIKLTGTVEVRLPGQPARPATLGMAIPQGSLIQTGADGQAFLETFKGGVAAIQKNTSVAVEKLDVVMQGDKVVTQEALLDLRQGNVVSTLDPAKKSINKYAVKTPKGVAAARGTVFSVTTNSIAGDSVSALTGTVEIQLVGGGIISLPVGGGEALFYPFAGAQAQSLASAVADNPTLKQDVVEAVQVVADNVKASTSAVGGNASAGTPDEKATATNTATAIMTAVFKAAIQAVPSEATTMTTAAVSAVSSSSSQTSGSSAAVAAITEAAVAAAPGSVNEIAKAASNAVVQTKVAEAVAAAKANNPTADSATLAAVAQKASEDAQATVQVVAQTAVNTAVSASGSTGTPDQKAAAAQAIADSVKAAAAAGSKAGGDTATNNAGVSNPTESTPPAVTVPDTTGAQTQAPSTQLPTPVEQETTITPIDPTTRSPQ
jgi:hypothetical protein